MSVQMVKNVFRSKRFIAAVSIAAVTIGFILIQRPETLEDYEVVDAA